MIHQDTKYAHFLHFVEFLEAEKHASPYTIRNYQNDIVGNMQSGTEKGFFQFLNQKRINSLEEVSKQIIREYLSYLLTQNVAKVSIARKISAIRSMFRYLTRQHLVSHNPIELIECPKLEHRLPSFLTQEEVTALLSMTNRATPAGLRDRAILEVLYASGMRISELTQLDLDHIDTESREMRVTGKGNKERIVIIGKPAAHALQEYLSSGRNKLSKAHLGHALFVNNKGKRLTNRWVQILLNKYASAAGINKRVHPHMLRHTFATHILDGGADLRVVQDLLGHTKLATTQIYTHVTQKRSQTVYLKAHPMAMLSDTENEYTATH